jgi:signal peptidase
VVVALKERSYERGDVVVYRVPAGEPAAGDRVIHRIVGGSAAKGFVMKGDNKDGIDPWRPTPKDVIGKERLAIPQAGQGLLFLRTPLGVALLAGLTTLLVALAGGTTRKRRVAVET